jgi:hypothetical protein
MAHFAGIDESNIVQRVLVVPDDEQHRGEEYLADDLGLGGAWVQTSFNTHAGVHYGSDGQPDGGPAVAFNYAGIGYTWDGTGFAEPQPYGSWNLDENYVWQPPAPMPDDGVDYTWDEASTSWVQA